MISKLRHTAIPNISKMNKKERRNLRLNTIVVLINLMLCSTITFSQQITVNEHKVSLEKALKLIRSQQSQYGLFFDRKDFKGILPIDLSVNNASVEEAIKKVLYGQPLTYSINEKVITIRPKILSIPKVVIDTVATADITGLVVDETGKGLHGATVRIKNNPRFTLTGDSGFFLIRRIPEKTTLVITFVGYEPKEVVVNKKQPIHVKMTVRTQNLDEVSVSNGYQLFPKERATGSFILIDSALLNRKVSTNILDRLDGVTSGVLFNKNPIGNTPAISVRGRSTIFANTNPLIVLDNFPYDGDISNINPNDVKSITILKDASAASIWGSRSGNGVIVITTKQGHFNQKPVINFNANITVGRKPDLYFKDQLSGWQYIDIEQFLFDKGKYNSKINNGYSALSPAVEVMLLRRKNLITDVRKAAMLDSIASHDNRDDLNKYFYRKNVNQQYQLSVNGGGIYNKYYISMGYDKNLANSVTSSFDRFTMNANNTVSFFNDKLQFTTGLMFSSENNKTTGLTYNPIYPYDNLANQNGNALTVTDGTLRLAYVDTAGKGKLLDWHYKPLDELNSQNYISNSRLTDYKINLGLNYKIIPGLNFSLNYTYDKGTNDYIEDYGSNSYYVRNMINSFTQINQTNGSVTRPVPLGDIVTNSKSSYYSHYGRGQLNYEKEFSGRNSINVIAGYEIKDYQSSLSSVKLYGYDNATATNLNSTINPLESFPYYYRSITSKIPLEMGNTWNIDRYRSYYANGSYTYDRKYILSASARRDESNLFGVKTNQKGVPLWSSGLAWDLSKENFYHFSYLPYLKLRMTYGYNGNVDKTTSAFLTTQTINGGNAWGQPILQVNNPPNPSLRWEKVKNINMGIDFGIKNKRLTGTFEYWIKDGIDLIGLSPIAPQTGVSIFKGNSANMSSKGIDLILNTININAPGFKWLSAFLFNYNTDKITNYKVKQGTNSDIVKTNYINPLEGYSYYSLFSYKWMGLDNMGNPQSILNGKISKDYAAMSNSTNASELVYSGTLTPKYFGSIRNSFCYKSWELSLNVVYKFNYYFRRSSLSNFSLYQGTGYGPSYQQSDYNSRWQKPGDELTTNVPSLIYPAQTIRDDIYTYSDILVEKADHIRLQDLQLNYQINKEKIKSLPFSSINLYVYAANLGILWKATNKKIDPDYPTGIPLPTTTSLGLKANF